MFAESFLGEIKMRQNKRDKKNSVSDLRQKRAEKSNPRMAWLVLKIYMFNVP